MADEEVVTELTVDASGVTAGLAQSEEAFAKIEAVLLELLSALTGTRAEFQKMGDQIALTSTILGGEYTQTLRTLSGETGGLNAVTGQAAITTTQLSDAFSAVQTTARAATQGLGTINTLIAALGAGGALAIAIAGMKALGDAADKMGDTASALVTAADAVHLTTDELKALQDANLATGVSANATNNAIQHFAEQLDSVRQGTGNLYNELLRINPALALQMQTSKSMAVGSAGRGRGGGGRGGDR
jgi:hypothetical protein